VEVVEDVDAIHLTIPAGPPLKPGGALDQRPRAGKSQAGWVEVAEATAIECVGVFENEQLKAEALDLPVRRLMPPAELGDEGEIEIACLGPSQCELSRHPGRGSTAMSGIDAIVLAPNVVDRRRPAKLFAAQRIRPTYETSERL